MPQETQPDSLTALEDAAASHPGNIDDMRALADAYAARGRWNDAIETYRAAIALDATNADLHNTLGVAYEEVGNLEQAERAYKQAILLSPNSSMVYYNMGQLYEEQQRMPEAIQAFEKCLQYSSNADERSEVGRELNRILPERKDVIQMYKGIRSWAIFSVLIGGLSIFSGGMLDPIWGIALIIVAILSWKIRVPAMFVLYSVVLAWAAVVNSIAVVAGAGIGWLILTILQVFWAVSLLKRFRSYSRLPLHELFRAGTWPAHLPPPQHEAFISSRFASAGIVLAVVALVTLPSTVIGSIVLQVTTLRAPPTQPITWLLSAAASIAVLALGLSCAAVLSKSNYRGRAIGGVVISALVLAGWLSLSLVGLTSNSSQEFKSETGGFSIVTPLALKETTQSIDTGVGRLDIHIFMAEHGNTAYFVAYSDYPEEIIQQSNPDQLFDNLRDNSFATVNGKVITENRISLSNYPGRDLVMSGIAENGQEITIQTRMFLVGNRLYRVMVVAPKGELNSNEADNFLKSFRLLDK